MSKVLIAVGFLVLFFGQQTLNNDSVINLMKAGFSEDVIISAINRSLGAYDTSVDGLIALKNAGITNKEISAIVAKAYPQSSAALIAPAARAALPQSANKPRVFLRAQNHSSGWHESRDQAMEMSKDFQEDCPEVLGQPQGFRLAGGRNFLSALKRTRATKQGALLLCWFCPSTSSTAKVGRHPKICHPACPACPGVPWGLPWGLPWDRSGALCL